MKLLLRAAMIAVSVGTIPPAIAADSAGNSGTGGIVEAPAPAVSSSKAVQGGGTDMHPGQGPLAVPADWPVSRSRLAQHGASE